VNERLRWPDLGAVVLAAAAFATSSPLAKSVRGLSFAGIGAGRCAVAGTALLLLVPRGTWRAVRGLDGRGCAVVACGGLLLAAHFGFFLAGLLATSLAAAAAFVSLEPLAVVLAAWLAFGSRPNAREVVGIAIATVGALVVASGAGRGEHHLSGDALVLGAVAVYGVYVAFVRGSRETMPTASYAACVYLVAAVALAPLAIALGRGGSPAPSPGAWAAVVALGLVPTLVGHTLVQRAARRIPASVVALVSPGETVGSIAIGAGMGMAPTPAEWVGAAIVVAGATVAVMGARSR